MTWTNASHIGPVEWYEMYVKHFNPELALVGVRVLSQVISATSAGRGSQISAGVAGHGLGSKACDPARPRGRGEFRHITGIGASFSLRQMVYAVFKLPV